MKRLILILLAIAAATTLRAQTDSVMVFGTVTNYHMGTPMAACKVILSQEADTLCTAWSDAEGFFLLPQVPKGSYTLSVERDFSLYTANLVLAENAELGISVDTVKHVQMHPVTITAPKHMLQERLITSPDDPRLWNFSGNMHESFPASVGGLYKEE